MINRSPGLGSILERGVLELNKPHLYPHANIDSSVGAFVFDLYPEFGSLMTTVEGMWQQ